MIVPRGRSRISRGALVDMVTSDGSVVVGGRGCEVEVDPVCAGGAEEEVVQLIFRSPLVVGNRLGVTGQGHSLAVLLITTVRRCRRGPQLPYRTVTGVACLTGIRHGHRGVPGRLPGTYWSLSSRSAMASTSAAASELGERIRMGVWLRMDSRTRISRRTIPASGGLILRNPSQALRNVL